MSHIPERMCVGCRKMYPKSELVKLVAADEGIVVDKNQKLFGRGAYVCKNAACIALAKKKKALSRQLKVQVAESFYQALTEEVNG